jgi:cytohesin
MEPVSKPVSSRGRAVGQSARRRQVERVGRIVVVLWILGLVIFIVIAKLLQEASFGHLQRAAWQGNLSIVGRLVEEGVSVNQPCDFHGWTALHAAAHKGHVEIARFLLEEGANVNVEDEDGYRPLHNTADSVLKGFPRKRTEANRNRIAALLLEYGARVNATINHGNTPLHLAVLTDNVGLVQLLLENGADPNIKQAQGMTPLHVAFFAGKDRMQVVRLLLSCGADSTLKDEYGRTPMDYAKDYHPKLLELLGE